MMISPQQVPSPADSGWDDDIDAPARAPVRAASPHPDASTARHWLGLAVGSLIIAGLFALFLVVARTPVLTRLVTDPAFFKRCLVVHVNLALVVWFYAFLGALYSLLPARGPLRTAASAGVVLSTAGVVMLMAAAGMTGAQPVLSNYVPVIDHPLFLAGLVAFGGGLVLTFLDGRLLPGREVPRGVVDVPSEARPGLRAAAIAFLLAMVTFAASVLTTPTGFPPEGRYEILFWGGGHVLQFANEAAMVSIWLLLLGSKLERPVIGRGLSTALFGLFTLPLFGAPLLALHGTQTGEYRLWFMRLMQYAIFPIVSIFLVLCLRALYREHRVGRLDRSAWADSRISGFAASAILTVVGFVLGAVIRGSNTVVPAHYHAAIGAVTAAFMTVTYLLLEPLGLRVPTGRMKRLSAWQPLVFGVGQAVFAVGFALAGAHGMARKAYGAEQHIRTTAETVGLGIMGLGGLMAVSGGLVFLWIVGAAWRERIALRAVQARRISWQKHPVQHTRFRN